MWDLPGQGLEPVSHALAGRFLTTVSPGKPGSRGCWKTDWVRSMEETTAPSTHRRGLLDKAAALGAPSSEVTDTRAGEGLGARVREEGPACANDRAQRCIPQAGAGEGE